MDMAPANGNQDIYICCSHAVHRSRFYRSALGTSRSTAALHSLSSCLPPALIGLKSSPRVGVGAGAGLSSRAYFGPRRSVVVLQLRCVRYPFFFCNSH
ncbi:hypothetical protein B0H10DRAFT_2430876 [Mycena sp. CBHHK59/15]|nr:hypothetical protein B0H10DRAFT_2430876 [Mycena sp. CBHHK59/15]